MCLGDHNLAKRQGYAFFSENTANYGPSESNDGYHPTQSVSTTNKGHENGKAMATVGVRFTCQLGLKLGKQILVLDSALYVQILFASDHGDLLNVGIRELVLAGTSKDKPLVPIIWLQIRCEMR